MTEKKRKESPISVMIQNVRMGRKVRGGSARGKGERKDSGIQPSGPDCVKSRTQRVGGRLYEDGAGNTISSEERVTCKQCNGQSKDRDNPYSLSKHFSSVTKG